MNIFRRKIIVIGCGPHFQEKYYCVLEEMGVSIVLLIDLEESRDSILSYFLNKKLKPSKTIFLPENYRNLISVTDINSIINIQINLSLVDGVMICTEPKVRKPYTLWAISHSLPIFMDKPISAFSCMGNMKRLYEDYEEITNNAKANNVSVVVSCERRAHPGYIWVRQYIKKFIKEVDLPLTSIDIHFAGGKWHLPTEYLSLENHPFKYGYGILLHSGYHYIDLLMSFLSLNDQGIHSEKEYNLKVLGTYPEDQITAIGKNVYSLINTQTNRKKLNEYFDGFGETDIMMIGQLKQKNRVLSNFSLKMFGTSLCLRKDARINPKFDTRVRQENVIIHLGPLCSIHISSQPLKKLEPQKFLKEDFNITIMNSPLLPERDSIIMLNRTEISELFPQLCLTESINSYARKWQLCEFLCRRDGNSSISSHKESVKLLQAIYSTLKEQLIYQKVLV